MLSFVWVINSVVGYVFPSLIICSMIVKRKLLTSNSIMAIMFFIHRSKLVLDFALTIHAIHLLCTSFYSHSIPQNTLWWALQLTTAATLTVGGTAACQWIELRPMSFGGHAQVAAPAPAIDGDEEQGFGRGRGRGRGRDGAGDYEMVSRAEAQEAPAI